MKHITRKFKLVLALGVLAALAITGVAFAAGTPAWWDNPDGYTSWTQTVTTSIIENTGAAAVTVEVIMDVDNTQIPDNTKEVWAQAEWSVLQGSGTLLTGPADALIQWTNDPCPQSPLDPLPNPLGAGLMTYRGPMDPPGPEWLAIGDEFSYSIDVQPQCERLLFRFQLDPGASIDYRIEVQTLCFTPTAVTLAAFNAEPRDPTIWVAALTGGLLILAAGSVVIYRRRVKVANDA